MKQYLLAALAVAIIGGGGYGLGTLLDPSQELIPRSEIVAQDFGATEVLVGDITKTRIEDGIRASFQMRTLQPDTTVDGVEHLLEDIIAERLWNTEYILDCIEWSSQSECEIQIDQEITDWKAREISREEMNRIQIQNKLIEEDRAILNSAVIDSFL